MQISSVLFRWDIFAALCGKKLNQKSLIKTIKGKKSSASLAKIAGRKISGRKPYKVKIRAGIVKQSPGKKLLPRGHGPVLRYDSTNTGIAVVSSSGKIRAKKKGTCYISITALNGAGTKVKVIVK